jgi:hypothetical protein
MPTFGALTITPADVCNLIRQRLIDTCSDIIPPQFIYITDGSNEFTPDFSASNRVAVAIEWPSVDDADWQVYSKMAVRSRIVIRIFHRNMVDPAPRKDQAATNPTQSWNYMAWRVLKSIIQWIPLDGSGNCYFLEPAVGLGYRKTLAPKSDQYNEIVVEGSILYFHPE